MLKLDFNHTDFREQLRHFADNFKVNVHNNTIILPEEIGKGYLKTINFPNGLQGLISDYIVQKDLILNRTKNDMDAFTLRFDEVLIPDHSSSSKEAGLAGINPIRSAVYLGSTKYDWMFYCTSGTQVKSVNVLFSRAWLEQFIEVEAVGDIIKKYLSLRMSAFNYEPMDIEYKRLLNEVLQANTGSIYDEIIIQNRVMLLLERFFTRIYYKMHDMHFEVKLSNDDINSLKMVEKELLKDFTAEPPGINKLARMAAMSPSKLKGSFKEIFGLPVYQYYQKHRMNKAKAMLLSKKYSVKEVGMEVGYSNLSNFAKAFKKSFDQLPSDLL